MPATRVNLNGIHELDFNLPGITTATTSAGVTTISNTQTLVVPVVIGFVILNGVPGTNVAAMLAAPRAGSFAKCVVTTKNSDLTTALSFRIRQNGVDVFSADPSIAAGTSSGVVFTFTTLTSVPLPVNANDVFSIDILTGTANWQFTAQME
jgi:hypothetical protein